MTPDDEAKRRAEIARADAARRLMDNPLWHEAWDVLHAGVMARWQATTPSQAALREDLWRCQDVARVVRKHVEDLLTTGKAAELQLNEDRNG